MCWVTQRDVYLQLIVLLYFAGEYGSAWKLLEVSLELLEDEDQSLLATFQGKLRLLLNYPGARDLAHGPDES